jgi:hypothetical protein
MAAFEQEEIRVVGEVEKAQPRLQVLGHRGQGGLGQIRDVAVNLQFQRKLVAALGEPAPVGLASKQVGPATANLVGDQDQGKQGTHRGDDRVPGVQRAAQGPEAQAGEDRCHGDDRDLDPGTGVGHT